jgi:hypothetical protein
MSLSFAFTVLLISGVAAIGLVLLVVLIAMVVRSTGAGSEG